MSCDDDNAPFEPPPGGGNGGGGVVGTTIPPMFEDFWDDVTISSELNDIIIETRSVPDYRSPYFTPSSGCLLYTSPSPRDRTRSRMPSSA